MIISTAMTAEAIGRLKASPPCSMGLSRKSPTVAPSGRVRINAAQNSRTSRHIRPEIGRSEHCQSGAEYERSASVAEA